MIAFHRVKKSPLIIGIVDRIKINSKQLFPFSCASQSCPLLSANCTFRHILHLLLFRGDRSGMNKSSSATCLLYSDVVEGEGPPGQGKIRKRAKKQSRSRRFSFHKFYNFFFQLLYVITFFYTLFTHDIYPHPHLHPHP